MIGRMVGGAVIALGVLYFLAEGYVPVPQSVRDMWDKAWHKQVEPRQEEWEQYKKDHQLPPQSFSFTTSSGVAVVCTPLASCTA